MHVPLKESGLQVSEAPLKSKDVLAESVEQLNEKIDGSLLLAEGVDATNDVKKKKKKSTFFKVNPI